MKNWLRVFFTNIKAKENDLTILKSRVWLLNDEKAKLEKDLAVLRTEHNYLKTKNELFKQEVIQRAIIALFKDKKA